MVECRCLAVVVALLLGFILPASGGPLHRALAGVLVVVDALFAAPLPAFAKSKQKAEQQAIQKATRREAQQAMKEYKFAPRPELEGSMETG